MIVIAITKSPTKCIGISSFLKMIGDRDSDQKINDLTQPCAFESYFSGQYSVFSFHIEDKDLGTENYIHMRESKFWMG